MLKQEELNLNDTERKKLQYMSQLCDNQLHPLLARNTTLYDTVTNEFFEILDEANDEPYPMLVQCSFLGQEIEHCRDAFTPIFTDEGICYSFNILDRDHIFNELV
jgi:amiloride-sensitive sodium channel